MWRLFGKLVTPTFMALAALLTTGLRVLLAPPSASIDIDGGGGYSVERSRQLLETLFTIRRSASEMALLKRGADLVFPVDVSKADIAAAITSAGVDSGLVEFFVVESRPTPLLHVVFLREDESGDVLDLRREIQQSGSVDVIEAASCLRRISR